ncbi:cupin-like domain-containing protein [Caulobacter sp. FWC2]|uniref:cupin-like domain-containing protein n=1 Tax=Caulobacter sp. FWC2 TaxID=69664 RepID=UPI000C14C85F|nr:cupin-like domain-containing protein [Caulobacter sp. FWC2]PIB93423.1 cupin [Caulobacter sp. FWC2]
MPALTARRTLETTVATPADIPFDAVLAGQTPMVFKGLARDWPLVQAGLESSQAARDYIRAHDQGGRVVGYSGDPSINGRFSYDETLTAMNFKAERAALETFLRRLEEVEGRNDAPSVYVGSADLDAYFPSLKAANDLGLGSEVFGPQPPMAGIWIGNRTTAAAHYDMSNNIAVCAVGRRRFTLFPPNQVANLYPGPLEPTPGGQVVSLVDFEAPDFERHPGFLDAIANAQVAELEPGDVLVYPALWWHQVEALEPFNVLVNYWWNASPGFVDTPMTTLLHGLLSLRDRPDFEKQGWKALFDYYLFGPAERAGAHLPEVARGPLGPMDEIKARRLRAYLLDRLNR